MTCACKCRFIKVFRATRTLLPWILFFFHVLSVLTSVILFFARHWPQWELSVCPIWMPEWHLDGIGSRTAEQIQGDREIKKVIHAKILEEW